ncbi:hypothetical protein ANN_21888 [Periplaneta americana]|uniref:Uncharacterized protein n=1 Tax=Periplaneta americana TaxID=6978 RepID=A0ABQ8S6M0_PERAM|nr:hypothetical protein ANN_21888 [Periplaneta americana]
MWLADEPREFNLPTLPQRRITYMLEKLPSKYGVHSEDLLWSPVDFCEHVGEECFHVVGSPGMLQRCFSARRLRWAGHVARMGEEKYAYGVFVGRHEGKIPLEWPRRRWEDNIKKDLREELVLNYMETDDSNSHGPQTEVIVDADTVSLETWLSVVDMGFKRPQKRSPREVGSANSTTTHKLQNNRKVIVSVIFRTGRCWSWRLLFPLHYERTLTGNKRRRDQQRPVLKMNQNRSKHVNKNKESKENNKEMEQEEYKKKGN